MTFPQAFFWNVDGGCVMDKDSCRCFVLRFCQAIKGGTTCYSNALDFCKELKLDIGNMTKICRDCNNMLKDGNTYIVEQKHCDWWADKCAKDYNGSTPTVDEFSALKELKGINITNK